MEYIYKIALWFILAVAAPFGIFAQNNGVIIDTTVCGSFEWHGSTYTVSDTLVFSSEDSTMVDTTINLTVNHPAHSSTTIDTCGSYTWADGNGQTYTTSGDYMYSHPDANGCTQVDTLRLTIKEPTSGEETVSACVSYVWNEQTYTESGDYIWTTTGINDCDSVATLHLIILKPTHTSITVTECDSFTWSANGETYIQSNDYTYIHTDSNGCTQVDTLHLTVNHITYGDTTVMACESFTWHGKTYTETPAIAPTYTIVGGNHSDCDSVVTLHLTVNHGTHNVETETACGSYSWHDSTYTETGTYTYAYENAQGCASVDTLKLTVNHPAHTVTTAGNCGSYTWHDATYAESGDYTYSHPDANGCTQVDTLHLTIYNPAHAAVTVEACESYTWMEGTGGTYTTSDTYTYAHQDTHGCWQVDTLHLTINHPVTVRFDTAICSSSLPLTWHDTTFEEGTVSGEYIHHSKTVRNCDSIITFTLTVNSLPTVIISGEGSFCLGDNVTLTAMGASSYTWNNASTNPSITVGNAGTYTVTGTDANGCTNTTSKTVTENPTYDIPISASICQGESYNFFGQSLTATGSYTHTLYTSKGCDSVITLILTVNPLPNVTISGASSFCQGTSTMLTATGASTYVWGNTSTSSSITVSLADTYSVTGKDDFGCADTATKTVTVNPTYNIPVSESICQGQSYNFYGQILTTAGVYTHSLTTSKGCDSILTLTLTVNPLPTVTIAGESSFCQDDFATLSANGASDYQWDDGGTGSSITVNTSNANTLTYSVTGRDNNGCSNTANRTVTINPTYNITVYDTICDGESYNFFGNNLTKDSVYTHTLFTSQGCDSVITLTLTVNYPQHNADTVTECESFTWTNGTGATYNSSGTYMYTHIDVNGCIQVDTLHLTILYGTHNVETVTACESYTWHGMTYTTSGSYTYSYTNSSYCPSVDTLKLTVNYGTHNVETVTACESYTWNDITYTVSGTYTYSYENALGCPSVDTLHLTVNYGMHNVTDTTVCESFTWYGTTYTVSGTYTHPYTNASGCASVDTLKLTVNYGTHNVETVTACDVYAWKGMIYTISGSYTYSYTNALGCPSVDTLHLTIYPSFILQLSETICQSELPYHYLNGEIDTTFETGTPQSSEVDFVLSTVNGCDSVISLSLTVVPSSLQQLPVVAKCHADGTPYMLVYPQSGLLYQWYRDSVAIAGATGQYFVPEEDLQISTYCYRVHVRPDILHCGVMTDCWEKTEASNAKVRILPNPNSGHFRLLLPEGTANVQILDANGLTVMARTTDGATELEMDTGLANGLYFVKTFRKNGSSNVEKLIINR